MTKIMHPKDTARFEPAGQDRLPESKRVAYHLRTPSVFDRPAIKRAAAARGARLWGALELLGQVRREASDILADDTPKERNRVLGIVDARAGALKDHYKDITDGVFEWDTEEGRAAYDKAAAIADETLADFLPIAELLRQTGGGYAGMVGDNEVYMEVLGVEAARVLLAAWDNMGKFERHGFKGVSNDLLARIPEDHLRGIAAKFQEMSAPTRAEEKNSVSPSSGASAPGSSPAASKPRRKRRT